jgi:hypothetical protein
MGAIAGLGFAALLSGATGKDPGEFDVLKNLGIDKNTLPWLLGFLAAFQAFLVLHTVGALRSESQRHEREA